MTDEPLEIPTPEQSAQKAKQFDLEPYRESWHKLRILKLAMDGAKREYEKYRERLGLKIDGFDELVLDGEVVATYPRGAFNVSKFVKENPHIAKKYTKLVTVEEFDTDAFAADNEGLYTQYRTQSLRPKN